MIGKAWMMDLLGQMDFFWRGAMALLMIGVCGFLMLVILLQRGRGGGLTGAFGGAGGSAAFGAKTGDVFTWVTVVVAGVFVLLAITSVFVFDESPIAVAAPAPTPAAVPVSIPVEAILGDEDGAGSTADTEVLPVIPPSETPVPVDAEPADPDGGAVEPTPIPAGGGIEPPADKPASDADGDKGSPTP